VGIPVKDNAGMPDEYENSIAMYTCFQQVYKLDK